MTEKIKLALDWSPNANHIGFFVAKAKGFYSDEQLEVSLLSPEDDNYELTPAKKVELSLADFALCPMESIVSYRTKEKSFPLKAVATIFKKDLSAIASLKKQNISSPKQLDGKVYASYKARYEDEIVKQMIRNDGGKGDLIIDYPAKLGIWETLIAGKYDATWIFLNWEGVQAESEGIALNLFKMADFDIPYSYSPVIATNENLLGDKHTSYKKFMDASKQGFLYAKSNPNEAADILKEYIPSRDKNIDLLRAITYSSNYFGTKEDWGIMEKESVRNYLDWLYEYKLETKPLNVNDLVSNELIGN